MGLVKYSNLEVQNWWPRASSKYEFKNLALGNSIKGRDNAVIFSQYFGDPEFQDEILSQVNASILLVPSC